VDTLEVRTAPPKKEDEEAAQAAAAAAGLYGAPLMMNDTLMIANSAAYSELPVTE
jgi:thiamine monophosphate synthase